MATYKVQEHVPRALWHQCIENSDQGTIFLTMDFVESLGLKYRTYLVSKESVPVAGCMIISSQACPFLPYQGFFFINDNDRPHHKLIQARFEITEFLINYLVAEFGKFSQTHFGLADCRPFLWHNYHSPEKGLFKINNSYTAILDLLPYETLEDYLASIRTVRRQEYRKAKEAGIRLVDSKDVDLLCQMHEDTFKRQDIVLEPQVREMVRSITQNALEKKYGRLTMAMVHDQPASAIVFLTDKRRGYYMYGANDPQYRKTFASTYLLIDNIWRCKQDGLKEIDFVGVNSPNRGDYKLSFNPALVPVLETTLA